MPDVDLIPLDAIDEAALARDRASLDEAALADSASRSRSPA